MKTIFKIYSCAISISVTSWISASACCDYSDPGMFNLFHCVEVSESLKSDNTQESVNFWQSYSGLSNLWMHIAHFEKGDLMEGSPNPVTAALRKQGKTEALNLLALNVEFDELVCAANSWEREPATEEEYREMLQRIESLQVSGELIPRKSFLKMRCLYKLEDYAACLRLWEEEMSQWKASALRNRCEGYAAGCLFHQEQYAKAAEIYFRLGDSESILLTVEKMIENSSIEDEYQRDPNSPLLSYLLQDYANYFYHASSRGAEANDEGTWGCVIRDRDRMIQLAERVVREAKAKDLQMWQAFAGFLQLFSDNSQEAALSFRKAQNLPGGTLVKPLLKHYLLLADLDTQPVSEEMDRRLADELVYYAKKNFASHCEERLLSDLLKEELHNRISKYVLQHENGKVSFFVLHLLYAPYSVWDMNHKLSIDEVKQIRELLLNGTAEPLLQLPLAQCKLSLPQVNEMLGTKLLRKGKFQEAMSYFRQVPTSYVKQIGAYAYLATRQWSGKPFTRTQYTEEYEWDDCQMETRNYKLEFCQEVEQLRMQILCSFGEKRLNLEYKLADMLFQASPAGDLWAISEYELSSAQHHYNALNRMVAQYLHHIIATSQNYNLRLKSYYGLAANPDARSEANIVHDWHFDTDTLQAGGSQYAAYQWLKKANLQFDENARSCDWLKLYVKPIK